MEQHTPVSSQKSYDDIIQLARPVSKKHPPMPRANRAAQFGAFQALNGYEEAVEETARLTQQKRPLSEEEIHMLNNQLCFLQNALQQKLSPSVTVTFFQADLYKEGGAYRTKEGILSHIDPHRQILRLSDYTEIPLEDIEKIETPLYNED